jgi:hypothetical protein
LVVAVLVIPVEQRATLSFPSTLQVPLTRKKLLLQLGDLRRVFFLGIFEPITFALDFASLRVSSYFLSSRPYHPFRLQIFEIHLGTVNLLVPLKIIRDHLLSTGITSSEFEWLKLR